MQLAIKIEKDQSNQQDSRKVLKRKPSRVFRTCPMCDSNMLLKIEDHVFCISDNDCDWNSVSSYLDALFIYENRSKCS
jgi:hypothetical protein